MRASLVALAAAVSVAHASTITTESFLQETDVLAAQPATTETMQRRGGLVGWLLTSPDSPKTTWCPGLLNDDIVPNKDVKEQMVLQGMLSSTAHAHASRLQPDKRASLKAGLRAALNVYEVTVARQPGARDAFLDGLLDQRDEASLERYMPVRPSRTRLLRWRPSHRSARLLKKKRQRSQTFGIASSATLGMTGREPPRNCTICSRRLVSRFGSARRTLALACR
jgi:hypothetical protein